MVKITSCFERQKKDGSHFVLLEITSGVELVLSQSTQRYYATVRKVNLPFTGSLEVAKLMIGQKLPGQIVRAICEPYQFINPRTNEVITLQHTWAYKANDSEELVGHTRIQELAIA